MMEATSRLLFYNGSFWNSFDSSSHSDDVTPSDCIAGTGKFHYPWDSSFTEWIFRIGWFNEWDGAMGSSEWWRLVNLWINGLTLPSVAMMFQLRAIDRKRIIKTIGMLESEYLAQLDEEIKKILFPDSALISHSIGEWFERERDR